MGSCAPVPIKEQGRPYYPEMCAVLERSSGVVLACEVSERGDDAELIFWIW
ncbi:MAG: hypothetical protein H6Q67_362 [Firmicutes bacterium]|nr:hypothetical protein [Bacillota bacterium]